MKAKTKVNPIKATRLAGNPFVLHEDKIYLIDETDYRAITGDELKAEGNSLDDYSSCTLKDANDLLAMVTEAAILEASLLKLKTKVEGLTLFGENPEILYRNDPDNDTDDTLIGIGCTNIKLKEAEAFLKRLNQK